MNNNNHTNNHNPKRIDPFHLAMICILVTIFIYWIIGSVQSRINEFQSVIIKQSHEIYTLNKRILLIEEYSDYAKKFNEFINNTDFVIKKLHQTSIRTNKINKNSYTSNLKNNNNQNAEEIESVGNSENEIMLGSEYDLFGNPIDESGLNSKINKIKNKNKN